MRTTIDEHEGATIVKMEGKVTIGVGDIQMRRCLESVAADGASAIIFDMHKISYMDSSGVGELVQIHQHLAAQGVQLCLTHIRPKLYGLLGMTRLVTVFAIYDSNEDAMQSVVARAA